IFLTMTLNLAFHRRKVDNIRGINLGSIWRIFEIRHVSNIRQYLTQDSEISMEFLPNRLKDFAVNDRADSCKVRLEFANGFAIERSRTRGKPDTVKTFKYKGGDVGYQYLEENEKGELKNTQKALDQILGINYATFCKSIVLGQNIVSNFISGGKEQR